MRYTGVYSYLHKSGQVDETPCSIESLFNVTEEDFTQILIKALTGLYGIEVDGHYERAEEIIQSELEKRWAKKQPISSNVEYLYWQHFDDPEEDFKNLEVHCGWAKNQAIEIIFKGYPVDLNEEPVDDLHEDVQLHIEVTPEEERQMGYDKLALIKQRKANKLRFARRLTFKDSDGDDYTFDEIAELVHKVESGATESMRSSNEEITALERANIQINFKPVYEVYKLQGKRWKKLNSLKDVWEHFISEEWLTKILIHTTGWGSETYSASRFRKAADSIADLLNSCRSGRRDVNFWNVQVENNAKDSSEIDVYFTLDRGREREQYCIAGWAEELEQDEEESKPLFSNNTQEDKIEWGRQMAMATEALTKHSRRKLHSAKEEQAVTFPLKALKALKSIGKSVLTNCKLSVIQDEIYYGRDAINDSLEKINIPPVLSDRTNDVIAGIKACIEDDEDGDITQHSKDLLKKLLASSAKETYSGYNEIKSEYNNAVRKYQKTYGLDGENDND